MTAVTRPCLPYEALSRVYDRWTAYNDYGKWAAYIADRVPRQGRAAPRVLDACCGTGRVSGLLQARGFVITGIDRSPEMLRHARERLGGEAELICGDLRDGLDAAGVFDAVFSTFDSLNYLTDDGDLGLVIATLARAIRPGGVLIFDVNSQYKMEQVHGDSHYGDDFDDFAYVWRNRHSHDTRRTTFLITVFEESDGGGYVRRFEQHQQRWFSHDEIRAAAASAGLSIAETHDDYTTAPLCETTLRETWVLRRS